MSACHYCDTEVVWVPTIEGFRPFVTEVPIPPGAPVVVLRRHECEERAEAFKNAQVDFARYLAADPQVRAAALTVVCSTCSAGPGEACLHQGRGREWQHTKNPHQPRLIEGARLVQEAAS